MPWRRKRSLSTAIDDYRRRALAREAKVARRLRGLYQLAEKQILRDIRVVVRKVEAAVAAGLPVEAAWLANLESSNELLARIRAHIATFSVAAGESVAKATGVAAADGATHALGMARAARAGSGFRRLNEAQLADLVGAMEPGSPLYDLFRDLGDRATSKARAILGEAAILGQNPRVVAKRLSGSIRNLTETRALLIARTETMRSYRSATLRSYRANSDVVTGWRWTSAKQSRTCPVCLAMDGKEFPLSVDFASHPSCRCMASPITAYSDPPDETGEQWFAKQPETVQRQILGPSKLDLYKSGRLKLSDLVEKTSHPRWGPGLTEASLKTLASKLPPAPPPPPPIPPTPPTAPSSPGFNGPPATAVLFGSGTFSQAQIDALNAAVKAIDSVHGGSKRLHRYKVAVQQSPLPHATRGQLGVAGTARLAMIELNSTITPTVMTVVHEFGHFVEMASRPGKHSANGLFEHTPADKKLAKAVQEFVDEAASTPEIQAILDALSKGGQVDFDGLTGVASAGYLQYLTDPWELWARAYAQFITVRSKETRLIQELGVVQTSKQAVERVTQWSDASFVKVEAAVERLLKAFGVM